MRRLLGGVVAAAALLAIPSVASAKVTPAVDQNGGLTITGDGADPITVICDNGKVKVNGANPEVNGGNPGTETNCSAITSISIDAGPGNNLVDLTGVTTTLFNHVGDVDVDGQGGDDELRGSEFADKLNGGEGGDRIVGFKNPQNTRDQMSGGNGNDTLVWNNGDGSDSMKGEAGADTIEVNGSANPENFTVAPGATAGHISFDRAAPGAFNLDIETSEKLDLNANAGDDKLNENGGVAGLDPFRIDADGGEGNDTLVGGDSFDVLTGGPGNDRLVGFKNPQNTRDLMTGGEGDDTLVWNNGDGSDTMNGEAGTDTIEVNDGAAAGDFTVVPGAPGHIAFDRLSPGPFNLDITNSEKLDLNGNAGDDKLNAAGPVSGLAAFAIDADGGEGNDTLNAADGPDTLTGANGDDTLNGGGGADLLYGDAGADTLLARDGVVDTIACGSEVDSVTADTDDNAAADCETVDRPAVVQPPATDDVAPLVGISRKAIRVNASRLAKLKLTCPASEPNGCVIDVELRRYGKVIGRARLTLDAGETRSARVKLSKKAFALLGRRGHLGVKALVDAHDDAGNSRRRVAQITLKTAK
jgi:Ca2+-binding RTX toxin-like protein